MRDWLIGYAIYLVVGFSVYFGFSRLVGSNVNDFGTFAALVTGWLAGTLAARVSVGSDWPNW